MTRTTRSVRLDWPFSPYPRSVCIAPPSASCPHPSCAGSPGVHQSSSPLRGRKTKQVLRREDGEVGAQRGSKDPLTVAVRFGLEVIDDLSFLLEIRVSFMELLPATYQERVCSLLLWSHVFKLNVRSSRILTNAPQAFSSVRRTLKKKKKKHKKLITLKTNTQGFLNGTHTHAHTHIYISCESQAVKELNHGPAGQRVGRTYDGLILAGLIDGGRQRETDREGQALTVNHHKHGLNSHTACTNVEQTLQSSVLQSQGSIWSVCHANTLLLHMGTLLTQF